MRTAIKIVSAIWATLLLIGLLVDTLMPKPPMKPPADDGGTSAAHQPAYHDSRFNGREHPMYGKNFYQAGDELMRDLQRSGASEDQIRLAAFALEAMKCPYCNGYGRREHYPCEACRGDGVLEN